MKSLKIFQNKLWSMVLDLTHLFYPTICIGCNNDISSDENILCLRCILALPHTNFASFDHNPIDKIFYGRTPIISAHSEFYFSKESVIQTLIHQLKYKNNKEVGVYLGNLIGNSLLKSKRFKEIDYIIPLPLNPVRERKRGYNQAAVICDGISEIIQVAVLKSAISRVKKTATQTKKNRLARWENVNESFCVKHPNKLIDKKILLVDDVLTTGATLEACAQVLASIKGIKIHIATVAYASKLN